MISVIFTKRDKKLKWILCNLVRQMSNIIEKKIMNKQQYQKSEYKILQPIDDFCIFY
jgi:hypothetical protein